MPYCLYSSSITCIFLSISHFYIYTGLCLSFLIWIQFSFLPPPPLCVQGCFPAHYLMDIKGQGRLSCLDNNHTHFLLVDDGTQGRYGVEIELRSRLEKYISGKSLGTKGYSWCLVYKSIKPFTDNISNLIWLFICLAFTIDVLLSNLQRVA